MAYLYGDSSSSKLEINYIQLLRDALEFSVEILLSIHRIRKWEESQRERQVSADGEIARLTSLETNVLKVVSGMTAGQTGSPVSRCAASITRSVESAVGAEISSVKSGLADDLARMEAEIKRERAACVHVLEALLLRHDLPEASRGLHIQLDSGTVYHARLLEAALHLECVLELKIPPGHPFAQPLKVERFVEHLEVRAPDRRGWLHKKLKLVQHKLGRQYITEVLCGTDESTIRIRTSPDNNESGFDIVVHFDDDKPRVELIRVAKEGGESPRTFQPTPEDAEKLLEFHAKVVDSLEELYDSRTRLLDATLDGKPLDQHDNPAILVERLVASMSPIVREIAGHSLSPDELVLKRVLSDDRREEIFVTKADLLRKLDRLPIEMRSLFEPLGLGRSSTPGTTDNETVGDDEEVTAVSTPSGALPIPKGVARRAKRANGGDGKDNGAAAKSGGGDDSDVIPIEEGWLEEDSKLVSSQKLGDAKPPKPAVDKIISELENEGARAKSEEPA